MIDVTFKRPPLTTIKGATEKLLDAIGKTMDGVYAVDQDHRIILWNPGAQRILGYSAEEVLGKACYEILVGRDERGHLVCHGGCADMVIAKAGNIAPTRNLLTQAKDGQSIWLNVTNISVPSEFGGLTTMVHIFRDVTAHKHMEQLVQGITALLDGLSQLRGAQPNQGGDGPGDYESLTPRERQVLRLLAEGKNAATIAQDLVISLATVRKHIQNTLKKLNLHTTLEAVAYCSRHNLFNSPTR